MKYPRLSRFTFHVSLILLITSAYAQVVNIPDPNLRGAITEALELPANTPITQQEMLQLMTLDIRGSSIANLAGLEYAANLEVLYSMNNQITDISPLVNLTNLTHLYLGDNALQTIEPIAGLINLRVLDLYNTGVKDITPLANLTALESLVIVRNMIVDISPLVGLKNLKRVQLAENPIQDFSPLAQLEGVELDLDIDLSRLDQLNNVVEVPDPNLRQAIRETLSLPDGVPLTQLEILQLTSLEAGQRNITDLTGLQYATNLENLHLSENQIQDLTPLANLKNLIHLDLFLNIVESVEPLAGLIQLRTLNLFVNRVQDITPLANLTNLERLKIHENLVTDITPLQGLNLIEFQYDEICDISPIAPPVRERMENRNFPSIFAWGGSHSTLELDHLTPNQRAALHDLDFGVWFSFNWDQTPTEPFDGIATSLAGNLSYSRETHRQRLDLNPNMLVLFGVGFHSHYSDEAYPPGSDYFLRDENGEIIRRDTGSPNINFLHPEVQDLLAKRIIAAEQCGLYDGVMIDQFANHGAWGAHIYGVSEEEIIQAFSNIFRTVREQTRDDFLILINANRSKATRYTEYVNGTFMETGSDNEYLTGIPGGYTHDGLKEIESTLLWSEVNLRSPQINCLEGWGIPAEPPDSSENRRWMRVITTLSLTHSDGYVMYDTGRGAVAVCPECPYVWGAAHQHIWYDFWDADLGQPVGEKAQHHQNIQGLFIREFTNGWAVYNRSGKAQEISLPHVTGVSSGQTGTIHQLADLDGEIYLKAVVEQPTSPYDLNKDGVVNVLDLILTAQNFGSTEADINGDGTTNILDLILVAQHLGETSTPAAPAALPASLSPETVQAWIDMAHAHNDGSVAFAQGIAMLERLLASIIPDKTVLRANYPNPFNPETWIPYHLANDTEVRISIYDIQGALVRQFDIGYQKAGYYTDRGKATYWDGRNEVGESVASGVYFYTLTTDDYTGTRRMVILK